MEQDICQVRFVHKERVEKALDNLPAVETMDKMVTVYKLLGEPMRLKIMLALCVNEMCVCDLATLLEASASATSHQLKLLRLSGLVQARREGKMMYYSIGKDWDKNILLECCDYARRSDHGAG